MTRLQAVGSDGDLDNSFDILDGNSPPLIPPGEYSATYMEHETAVMYNRPRLRIYFEVEHQGKPRLERFYGCGRLLGPVGVGGKFTVLPRGDFAREFVGIFKKNLKRLDRPPMSFFKGVSIRVKVDSVTCDRNGETLPRELWYSKISRLVGVSEVANDPYACLDEDLPF